MRLPALILLAVTALPAQEPQARQLLPPTWTSADAFSALGSIRELSDGRVIAIDHKENRLILFSASGATAGDIGRVGSGPGEFRQPVRLIPLQNDSTALLDATLRRFLLLDGARPVGTLLFPQEHSPGVLNTRAADERGRFIFITNWVSTRADGAAELLPILAWDRRTNRVDTVAMALAQRMGKFPFKLPNGNAAVATAAVRFSPVDEWALLSTGEIGILHSDPYSMDIFTNGNVRLKGAAVSYDRVKVEPSERVPADMGKEYPEYKGGFGSALARPGPSGDLWIARAMPASATTRIYDRFDRMAKRTYSITMERAIIIIGFGRDAMYTVRTDADGLQWLEKRPIPK